MSADIRELKDALEAARQALVYSISSLESIVALDDEDLAPDGGSIACQACVKINRRALEKVEEALS